MCQRALTQKRTLRGSSAPQLADLGLLEDGGELGDALSGVLAAPIHVDATELVVVQAAMSGVRMVREEFKGALTQKQTLGRRRRTPARSRSSP